MSDPRDPPNLRREEGREQFERELAAMRAQFDDPNHSLVTNSYIALEWQFDQEVQKEQGPLLANPLMWDESDQRLANWILRQFVKLVDMGKRVADLAASVGEGDPVRSYVIARVLVHHGNLYKWAQFANCPADEQGFGALNSLYKQACRGGLDAEHHSFNREGRPVTPTIAGLYLRAHLLARIAGGNLNRQQTEILDAWLWAAMPELPLVNTINSHNVLRLEPGGHCGIQFGKDEAAGEARYLDVESLRRVADRAEEGFHRGSIFPGHGSSQSFRLEEHVAVLDFLRALIGQIEGGHQPQRAKRLRCNGSQVQVHCGLSDIVRNLGNSGAALTARLASIKPSQENKIDTIYEMQRRYMALVDQSDTGLGLEVTAADASDIGVGEIIAVVFPDGSEPVMGQVARIVPSTREGVLRIGVHLVFKDFQPVDMRVADVLAPKRDATAFYVPGPDSSGRHDVLLVSESFAQGKPVCEVRLGEQAYGLRLNHICRRGRGWAAVEFEVIDVREAPMSDQPLPVAKSATGALPVSLV